MGDHTRKVKKKNVTGAQGSRYERLSKLKGKANYRIRTQKKIDEVNTLRTK